MEPSPFNELVSCGVETTPSVPEDIYPIDPKPWIEEKSLSEDDIYPIVPKPATVEKRGRDDEIYPYVPKPATVEVSTES